MPVSSSSDRAVSDFQLDLTIQLKLSDLSYPLPSIEMWNGWFHTWLVTLQPQYSPIRAYELSLCLTTDEVIQSLNHQYRQRDRPTDVLSFAALDGEIPPAEFLTELPLDLGDIIISVETAQRQALDHNHPLELELAWLAAHGFLHLLEWDHPDDAQLRAMLNQQVALLSTLQLAVSTDIYDPDLQ